jgi:hypothetical protein
MFDIEQPFSARAVRLDDGRTIYRILFRDETCGWRFGPVAEHLRILNNTYAYAQHERMRRVEVAEQYRKKTSSFQRYVSEVELQHKEDL